MTHNVLMEMTQHPVLTDTHTHIYYTHGTAELDSQLQRCFENGVLQLLLPNVDRQSIPKVLGTAAAYPANCFPMMGLHPCEVQANYLDELAVIEKTISDYKCYAIGEIGIDLHWDKTTLPLQQEAFRVQANWAKELGLPVSIHCRNAFDELFQLLDELQDGRLTGVLHCFTGTIEQARHTIDMGLHLGIGGVVTYKNAGLPALLEKVPLEHIVLETDAPYLSPVPYRGKRNQPAYLVPVVEKLAMVYGKSPEEIAAITTSNANKVFKFTHS